MKCRNESKENYYQKVGLVSHHQMEMDKNRSRPGREDKFYHHQSIMQRIQQESELALNNYNSINQRVLREMDRFKRETEVKMKKIIKEYVALQVDYYAKMENIWSVLVKMLEEESNDQSDIKPKEAPVVSGV